MTNRIVSVLVLALTFLLTFTASAFAAGAGVPDESLVDLAKPVFQAVMSGNYVLAAAAALVLVVAAVARRAPASWTWVRADWGRALLVFLGSFGGAAATALTASAAVTWAVAYMSVKVAFAAAGGYSLLKPLIKALEVRAPAWLAPLFKVLGWVFNGIGTSPVVKAEAAGDAAVKADPPTGVEGVVGEPTDVP